MDINRALKNFQVLKNNADSEYLDVGIGGNIVVRTTWLGKRWKDFWNWSGGVDNNVLNTTIDVFSKLDKEGNLPEDYKELKENILNTLKQRVNLPPFPEVLATATDGIAQKEKEFEKSKVEMEKAFNKLLQSSDWLLDPQNKLELKKLEKLLQESNEKTKEIYRGILSHLEEKRKTNPLSEVEEKLMRSLKEKLDSMS